ncbi:MAG: hypothetical protein WAT92_04570 [Saprospiraceae bacterium]
MKNLKFLSLFILLFTLHNPMYSQLGNLVKKAKEATKKEAEPTKPQSAPEPTKTVPVPSEKPTANETRNSPSNERTRDRNIPPPKTKDKNAKPESKVQVADMSSSVLSPAIAWYSLLDQDNLYYDAATGYFRPTGLDVLFLPEKDINGQPMNFKIYDTYNPPPLRLDVIDNSTGNKKVTFYYRADVDILPAFKMKIDDRGADPLYPAHTTLLEGSYDLKFYINENLFYTFPIKIEKVSNKDPYSPLKQLYFMRGEWEEWGRVEYNSGGDFIFSHYLPERDVKVTNQSRWDETVHYPFTAKLLRNGKVVGNYDAQNEKRTLEKGSVFAENAKWVRNQNAFYAYPPVNRMINDNHSHDYVYTKDMIDGNYTVETEIFKPSGVIKNKYDFTIKNGKFVPDPRADRSLHSDPFTLLEQGPNYHYIRKSKM